MDYFDRETKKLKDQARENGVSYSYDSDGCGYNFSQCVTDRYGNSGRYEYQGSVYSSREERDYVKWCDHY